MPAQYVASPVAMKRVTLKSNGVTGAPARPHASVIGRAPWGHRERS